MIAFKSEAVFSVLQFHPIYCEGQTATLSSKCLCSKKAETTKNMHKYIGQIIEVLFTKWHFCYLCFLALGSATTWGASEDYKFVLMFCFWVPLRHLSSFLGGISPARHLPCQAFSTHSSGMPSQIDWDFHQYYDL